MFPLGLAKTGVNLAKKMQEEEAGLLRASITYIVKG